MRKQGISQQWFFALIVSLAIFFVLGCIWKAINNSGYFNVKEIVYRNIDDAKKVDLSYLLGENIFSLDLRKESSFVLSSFPQYYQIRLARVLPDRLFAEFSRRRPVALLSGYRNFALDENGVFFYFFEQSDELGLPLILGLENKISHPKPGQRCNFKELVLALDIVRAASANKVIKNFKLKKILVLGAVNLSVFFEGIVQPAAFEVKIGQGNIEDKFDILASLIMQGKNELGRVEYFDLRFKEPILKLKDITKK